MQKVKSSASGFYGPLDPTPLLFPSFNSGTITATQSGNTVTVDFGGTAHNILSSAAGMINNVGVSVYFKTTNGIIKSDLGDSGYFKNIIVTSTSTFTCTSNISQTVTTPQAVTAGTGFYSIEPQGILIPANTLSVGSSIRFEQFFTHSADVVRSGSINTSIRGRNAYATNQSGLFWNETIQAQSRVSSYYECLFTIRSSGPDADIIKKANTVTASNALTLSQTSGQNIGIGSDILLTSGIQHAGVANDWTMLVMSRAEVVI